MTITIPNGRRKSKSNPDAICKSCDSRIYNKQRHALYCKDCSKVIHYFTVRIAGIVLYMKAKKFPNIKIKYKLKVTIERK